MFRDLNQSKCWIAVILPRIYVILRFTFLKLIFMESSQSKRSSKFLPNANPSPQNCIATACGLSTNGQLPISIKNHGTLAQDKMQGIWGLSRNLTIPLIGIHGIAEDLVEMVINPSRIQTPGTDCQSQPVQRWTTTSSVKPGLRSWDL